jgi:putative ABC transport system permease protein
VVAALFPQRGATPDRADVRALTTAAGVVAHSGPYPLVATILEANGHTVVAQTEGRDSAPAGVDQPKPTAGGWIRGGGVVLEAAFAAALGVSPGDRVTLEPMDPGPQRPGSPSPRPSGPGRSFRVAGVAATAAAAPYPEAACLANLCQGGADTGVVWLTRSDAVSLASDRESLVYILNLKLADPAAAPAFVADRAPPPSASASDHPPLLQSWQEIRDAGANLVDNQRRALLTGAWLLALLAVASVAVLVGGRMADQIRRVGLLKAIGGTPSLVAAVLLAEYLVVALLAAAAGLVLGSLAAPLIAEPSAGLLGRGATPTLTASTVGLVTGVALAVAVAATLVPAMRAARTSTVLALADAARTPRRIGWLIALSARMPVPLLLGLRVTARRPRRVVLATASIAITVSGIVAALAAHADLQLDKLAGASVVDQLSGASGSVADASRADRLNQLLLVITLTLLALAAVNMLFITWATALDARRSSALARALGATPQQVSAALSAAQVLPALVGGLLGIPGGILLIEVVDPGSTTVHPAVWQLVAVVPATVLVVAALTAVPARLGARRPVADALASELA